MGKLLIKYASKSRPKRMLLVLNSILKNINNPKNVVIVLSITKTDNLTYNKQVISQIQALQAKHKNIRVFTSNSSSKIEAYNKDIESIEDWDYLLPVSDYTEICLKGFDTAIIDYFKNKFIPGLTPTDMHLFKSVNSNGKNLHYLPVLIRTQYEQRGFLYNPLLKANYQLDELLLNYNKKETPVSFHRYVHPKWLYFNPDQQLTANILFWKKDLATFEKLKG